MRKIIYSILFLTAFMFSTESIKAQTTGFTYQGQLQTSGAPASGSYDFEFALYDAASGGSQVGSTIVLNGATVTNGVFSTRLDFGDRFPGASRFLEIRVRQTGGGAFTTLAPRQAINSVPYSIKTLNADNAVTANNALSLGGTAANQYVQTLDARLTDARSPLPNSANYIQNATAQQSSTNFNIDGTGTANVFSAAQFNIGSNRVLSSAGTQNIFVGRAAGQLNTSGFNNSFFGFAAGQSNTTGSNNTFVGTFAGLANSSGSDNSFFGRESGGANSTGYSNSFFGKSAGQNNTTGYNNSFFGKNAGFNGMTGANNSFFGANAGENTVGYNNSFFGASAGLNNTNGLNNSFFGTSAGLNNTTGNSNSFFGNLAGQSNTIGYGNSFFGTSAGKVSTTGGENSFFGLDAGNANTNGRANAFFGAEAGNTNVSGSLNVVIGAFADVGESGLVHATAIGASAKVYTSDTVVIGKSSGASVGRPADTVQIPGHLVLYTLGAAGSTTICRNSSNQISTCSSSLRYKTNIAPFNFGLGFINRLRPIRFDWKEGGKADIGFGAEEVAQINPLFVEYNDKGEVEGVKYDRLSVVFVNAFKEQQRQIAEQQQQLDRQQKEIELLRQLVCSQNTSAKICKGENQK